MQRIMMNLTVMLLITIVFSNDLDFEINNKFIDIKNDSGTVRIEKGNIDSLICVLDNNTERFEDDVRIGKRKQVYSKISVNVTENMKYKDVLDILFLINRNCYQILDNVNILGIKLNLINEINPGNYMCWNKSATLNDNNLIKSQNNSINCATENIRVYADENKNISNVVKTIRKKTDINKCIYQLCSASKCFGMNGNYSDEPKINDLIELYYKDR